MKRVYSLFTLVGTLALVGCQATHYFSKPNTLAKATLEARSGSEVSGEVTFEEKKESVLVSVNLHGLKPNSEHGFHVHEKGDCSAPDASSAGGHFNPDGHPHGNPEQLKRHAGAMKNLIADQQGNVITAFEVDTIRLNISKYGILNRALIVHANPDDYSSQPVGNAGGRLACGIIRSSR
ncbi:MAG: superoxide dismutase family protein [Pseudomonadota bacterium]